MKSLSQFISEAIKLYESAYDSKEFFDDDKWKLGYKYYNAETGVPTLEEIENAFATEKITDDPSFGAITGMSFDKTDKNAWSVTSAMHKDMGKTYTNEQILDMIKKTKDKWFLMLRFEK